MQENPFKNQTESEPPYQNNPMVTKTTETLRGAKEHLKDAYQGVKIIGTILFSLGVFEIVSAQADTAVLDKAVAQIEIGATDLGTTVNALSSAYQQLHADSTQTGSVIQIDHSLKKGGAFGKATYGGGITMSGKTFTLRNVGDTTQLGDVLAENFSVLGTQSNEADKTDSASTSSVEEYGKYYTSVIIQPASNKNDTLEEKSSAASMGKTPQEAALSALSIASQQKSSMVNVVSSSKMEQENNKSTQNNYSKFICITCNRLFIK